MLVLAETGKKRFARFIDTLCRLSLFEAETVIKEWTIGNVFGGFYGIDAEGNSYFVEEACRPRVSKQVRDRTDLNDPKLHDSK